MHQLYRSVQRTGPVTHRACECLACHPHLSVKFHGVGSAFGYAAFLAGAWRTATSACCTHRACTTGTRGAHRRCRCSTRGACFRCACALSCLISCCCAHHGPIHMTADVWMKSNCHEQTRELVNLFHNAAGRKSKYGGPLWQLRQVWLLPTSHTSGCTHLRTETKGRAPVLTVFHSSGHLAPLLSQRTLAPRRMLEASRSVTMASPTWRDDCGSSKPPYRCLSCSFFSLIFFEEP